nr:MAG TPA: hypothetical protein [Bacteriophage sp.]
MLYGLNKRYSKFQFLFLSNFYISYYINLSSFNCLNIIIFSKSYK